MAAVHINATVIGHDKKINEKSSNGSINSILYDCLYWFLINNKDINELDYEQIIDIIKSTLQKKDVSGLSNAMKIFKLLPNEYVASMLEVAKEYVDLNQKRRGVTSEAIEYILHTVKLGFEKEAMWTLGERLEDSQTIIKGPAHKGLFDVFRKEIVSQWIDEDPVNRAPLIAYHLQSPSLEEYNIPELTGFILSKYESMDAVFDSFIHGRYNLVLSLIGGRVAKRDQQLAVLEEYKLKGTPRIYQWACYEQKELDRETREHEAILANDQRLES